MRQFVRSVHLARICFGLAAAWVFCAANSLAQGQQPPLVYPVENTGASYPAPTIPDFAHLPIVRPLPDPFLFFSGTHDTSWGAFEQHRNEWMYAIEQDEIGNKPDCHDCAVTASFVPTTGSTTKGTLTINVTRSGNPYTLTFTSAITLPTPSSTCVQPASGWPYVIGMGSATGSWPGSAFNASTASPSGVTVAPTGCAATVVYSLNSVTVYKGGQQTSHVTDPFYQLYPEYCAGVCNATNGYPNGPNHGQYAAWTWGVSRLIDAIQSASQSTTNPLPLDTSHSAATGCSYAGKMAMWSGALDERIALTIAQENGGGGAPSWRISHEIETQGSVEDADDTDYSWFNGTTMRQFSGANIYKLPEDHHELMAMVAPRALLQTGDSVYYWLGDRSATFDSLATEKIYANYGIGDRFGYYIDDNHNHCVVPAYQQNATQPMINRFLFGQNVPTTLQVSWQEADALQPGLQPTIDPNMWTAWWGTGNPTFPAGDVWNNGGDLMLPLNQNLAVNTGDTLSTSYAVSMPGSHAAATVKYPYGYSETDVSCTDGTSYTLTIPAVSQSFAIPANDNSLYPSAPGSVKNPGCANGAAGQTTANYFFALGIQSPGAGNPGLSGFTTTDGNYLTAQTDPLDVSFNVSDSSTSQGGAPTPTTTVNWENPYSCPQGCPLTPTLAWQAPTTLIYGVPLSASQLNAMATATQISGLQAPGTSGLLTTLPVPGTFSYSPGVGAVLPQGQQTVSVTFTPTNLGTKWTNFTVATASVPVLVGTVTVTTTGSVSKTADGYQMLVTVTNSGNVTAPNVQLTGATLGAASGAPLPASLGDIPSGGSATVSLTFPSSAGADGAGTVERLAGTYNGGTFGGSFRVVLP